MDSPLRLAGGYVLGWVVSALAFVAGTALVAGLYGLAGPGNLVAGYLAAASSLLVVAVACAVGVRVLPRRVIEQGPVAWSLATLPGPLLILITSLATAQAALRSSGFDGFLATPPAAALIAAIAAALGVVGSTLVGRARHG
ncbi:MAG: hypothetical protein Q4G43_13810 [Mobilicoccus sp.]|nr:hypothetical protein [Mobilicoccus sp.]